MKIRQIAKSKTISFNALVPAIVVILGQFGVEVSTELAATIMSIGNIILRLVTKVPISEK